LTDSIASLAMASTQLSPLHHNVPIVDPETGNPTPFFQQMIQQLLNEKGVTDDLADGAIQPGTVTTSGLTAAAQRLLGNKESTAGAIEELTLSQALDLIGSASHGDLLFRGASGWQRLAAGTSGQFLKTLGAGDDPAWASGGGGGTAWSLAATWSWSTNTTSVPFTGLAGANDIMVIVRGMVHSVSGAARLQVSTDNGTTYFSTSGNYVGIVNDTGLETNDNGPTFWNTATTSARSGSITIFGANATGGPRLMVVPNKTFSTQFSQELFVGDNAHAINAIRVVPSSGNFTAGSIYVFTR
jgi:hypothetical protein